MLALDGGLNGLPASAALLITVYHVNEQAPRIRVEAMTSDGLAKVGLLYFVYVFLTILF